MTRNPNRPIARTLALLAAVTLTTVAQAEPERVVLRHVDLHPATEAAAKHTMRRIDEAALRACGESSFSLSDVKTATRKDGCWQDAVGSVVQRSGDPLLAQAFTRFALASR